MPSVKGKSYKALRNADRDRKRKKAAVCFFSMISNLNEFCHFKLVYTFPQLNQNGLMLFFFHVISFSFAINIQNSVLGQPCPDVAI